MHLQAKREAWRAQQLERDKEALLRDRAERRKSAAGDAGAKQLREVSLARRVQYLVREALLLHGPCRLLFRHRPGAADVMPPSCMQIALHGLYMMQHLLGMLGRGQGSTAGCRMEAAASSPASHAAE